MSDFYDGGEIKGLTSHTDGGGPAFYAPQSLPDNELQVMIEYLEMCPHDVEDIGLVRSEKQPGTPVQLTSAGRLDLSFMEIQSPVTREQTSVGKAGTYSAQKACNDLECD